MEKFPIYDDVEIICELLSLSVSDIASAIGVFSDTVTRWKEERTEVSEDNLNAIYDFAFKSGVRINKIKEQLYREECNGRNKTLLFHGAKAALNYQADGTCNSVFPVPFARLPSSHREDFRSKRAPRGGRLYSQRSGNSQENTSAKSKRFKLSTLSREPFFFCLTYFF